MLKKEHSLGEYAKLCQDSYYPEVEPLRPDVQKNCDDNKKNPFGFYPKSFLAKDMRTKWTRVMETLLPSAEAKDGFYAVFYAEGKDTDNGIIVFRGSDDILDFAWHDLKLAVGEWPMTAYKHARKFYQDVKKEHSIKNITLAGHSLGGALAQLVAHAINQEHIGTPSKQIKAVCFNAPQMGYLLEKNSQQTISDDLNIDKLIISERKTIGMHYEQYLSQNKIVQYPMLAFAFMNYLGQTGKIIRRAYEDLIRLKDLNACPSYSQPAFNAAFQMLRHDKQDYLLKQIDFEQSQKDAARKYPYIFNCNSLFDLVHTVGMSAGAQLNLDIDKNSDSPERLRNELRVHLTMQKDFLYHAGQYLVKENNVSLEKCFISVDKYMKNLKTDRSLVLIGLDYLAKQNIVVFDDLMYLGASEHTMRNLGNYILQNNRLNRLNIHAHTHDLNNTISELNDNFVFAKSKKEEQDRLSYILDKTGISKRIKKKDCVAA